MNERVTVRENRGQSLGRVTLPAPIWEGNRTISTGITLEAIYRGPRTGRMFIRTYSLWESPNGSGRPEGSCYTEIDDQDYLHYCERVGCDPIGVNPETI